MVSDCHISGKGGERVNAIKESFDNLSTAVCIFDSRGLVLLMNRRMLAVTAALLGSGVQTLEELQYALAHPPEEIVRLKNVPSVYRFPDGTVLRFRQEQITDADGCAYQQVTAADVTELVARQEQLAEENAQLADANRRARRLLEQMPEIVREQEILAMKMRVHDDIGHSILAARQALLGGAGLGEMRRSAAVWEQAVALLHRANANEESEDPLSHARRAEELHVRLLTDGALPETREAREMAALTIRECLTNCVRHAGATELYVSAQTDGGCYIVTITNNGAPPVGEITEGGGLSALRRRIERSGGTMTITAQPRFALTVRLPEKEETP